MTYNNQRMSKQASERAHHRKPVQSNKNAYTALKKLLENLILVKFETNSLFMLCIPRLIFSLLPFDGCKRLLFLLWLTSMPFFFSSIPFSNNMEKFAYDNNNTSYEYLLAYRKWIQRTSLLVDQKLAKQAYRTISYGKMCVCEHAFLFDFGVSVCFLTFQVLHWKTLIEKGRRAFEQRKQILDFKVDPLCRIFYAQY